MATRKYHRKSKKRFRKTCNNTHKNMHKRKPPGLKSTGILKGGGRYGLPDDFWDSSDEEEGTMKKEQAASKATATASKATAAPVAKATQDRISWEKREEEAMKKEQEERQAEANKRMTDKAAAEQTERAAKAEANWHNECNNASSDNCRAKAHILTECKSKKDYIKQSLNLHIDKNLGCKTCADKKFKELASFNCTGDSDYWDARIKSPHLSVETYLKRIADIEKQQRATEAAARRGGKKTQKRRKTKKQRKSKKSKRKTKKQRKTKKHL
jgi:hypothetical protein